MDIKKNENYIIEINDMTQEGQGVGRAEGIAVFVEGALPGETVEARIIKVKKTYGIGKLISIVKASPARIAPFCSIYGKCGGCSLQHFNYAAQLKWKTRLVRDSIRRIGGIEGVEVRETMGMGTGAGGYTDMEEPDAGAHEAAGMPMNYRNKAQYSVAEAGGKIISGFYRAASHHVIEPDRCAIQDKASEAVRRIVCAFMEDKDISAYDESSGKGLVRHIVTQVGFNTGELMVIIIINGALLPSAVELVMRLTDENALLPAEGSGPSGKVVDRVIKSIYININTEKTNVIMGKKNVLLYGRETITERIGDFNFVISPNSFFQVNPVQTEVLYSKVLEYAALTGRETVFDLYCGTGTIALFLAGKARKVYGVELAEEAVRDARNNAAANSIDNAEFLSGEAERVVPELYRRGIRADVAVLDPPRKGCDETLLQLLTEMRPDRIIYVSCNPATLARDLKHLAGSGYKAEEVQPVDMFPWTGHVETVVLITRVEK